MAGEGNEVSMKDLFGDEDDEQSEDATGKAEEADGVDDEDEEMVLRKRRPSTASAPSTVASTSDVKKPTMEDLFGDEGDEEMDDAEQVRPEPEKATMEALFGEDDEEEEQEKVGDVKTRGQSSKRPSTKELFGEDDDDEDDDQEYAEEVIERKNFNELFGEDDEDARDNEEADYFGQEQADQMQQQPEEESLERKDDEIKVPGLPSPPPGTKAVLLHVPKFLSFEHDPLPEHPDERFIESQKELAPSVVRWRWKREVISGDLERDERGKAIRESNARLVRWSNGMTQLVVGDVRFDVVERPLDKTYLFAQVKPEQGNMCMLAHARYSSDYRVLPPSLQSATHRQFTSRVLSRTRERTTRVKEIYNQEDPVKAQQERARLKDEQIRREMRRKQRANPHHYHRGRTRFSPDDAPSMSANFLEHQDPHTTSLKAVKRRAKTEPTSSKKRDYEEDDEDDFIVEDDEVEDEIDDEGSDEEPEHDDKDNQSAIEEEVQDEQEDSGMGDDAEEDDIIQRNNRKNRRVIVDDEED